MTCTTTTTAVEDRAEIVLTLVRAAGEHGKRSTYDRENYRDYVLGHLLGVLELDGQASLDDLGRAVDLYGQHVDRMNTRRAERGD